MNKPVSPAAAAIRGEEHWTHKGSDVRLFLWNKNAGDPSGAGRANSVRARIVHGLAADLRSARAGPHRIPRRWISSPRGIRHLVRRHGGLWPLHQGPRQQCADRAWRRRCFAAASYIEKLRGKRPLLVYGISSGALRAALFAQRHPEMVARLALDAMVWTGEGSPTLAERSKRLPEFRARQPPPDRPQIRALDLRARPSRHRRRRGDRGLRRCHPQARRFRADRHLCRHVRKSAGLRPGKDHGADAHHARRIRRHRELAGPR